MRASQFSWSGSGWPVREQASSWDSDAQVLRLEHDEEAKRLGVRAYMPDIIDGMKSHMDVQGSDGRGMLLRYVAGFHHEGMRASTTDFYKAGSHISTCKYQRVDQNTNQHRSILEF